MVTGRFTVLVVDDSAMFLQRVSCILHDIDLHPVFHARDYDEAVNRLLTTKVHLVLLDINLPGKSGIELLKLIRKKHPGPKVLMISNHVNEVYKQVCLSSGADYFFDKSLEWEQIAKLVQSIRDEEQKIQTN
jgi:DNA-binding NarL/FixJ family response regulator